MRRLIATLLLFCAGAAHAVLDQVSWEATRVVRVSGHEFVTHVNHTSARERISAVLGGVDVLLIYRGDRNLLWQLMPGLGVYGETGLDGFDTPRSIRIVARERLGTETVSGRPTTKVRVTFVTVGGTRRTGFYWEDARGVHLRSRFPVTDRQGVERQVELELRDVRVGAQAAALFELPPDLYRIPLDASTLLDLMGV